MARNKRAELVKTELVKTDIEVAEFDDLTGFEFERGVTLLDGQGVVGEFLGPGPIRSFVDANNGEVRELSTWRIRRENMVVVLLGSAMLDRQLSGVEVGERIAVQRAGSTRTRKGNLCTVYLVGRERA